MQNEIFTLTTPNVNLLNKEELEKLIDLVEDGIFYFLKVSNEVDKARKAQEINGKLISIYIDKFVKVPTF